MVPRAKLLHNSIFIFLNTVVLLVRVEKRKIIPSQGLIKDSEDAE